MGVSSWLIGGWLVCACWLLLGVALVSAFGRVVGGLSWYHGCVRLWVGLGGGNLQTVLVTIRKFAEATWYHLYTRILWGWDG